MPRSDALGHDWCMRWIHPPGQLQPEGHNDCGGKREQQRLHRNPSRV